MGSTTNPLFDASVQTRSNGLAAPLVPQPVSTPKRIWRALRQEFEPLNFRMIMASGLVSLLPDLSFPRLRTAIYRLAGLRIGAHSLILGKLYFTGSGGYGKRLRIGENCIINAHCFFDLNGEVELGDWVSVGHHVTFITSDHELGPAKQRAGAVRLNAVRIHDGSWIGACSTILPGADLGAASVLAAGSTLSGAVPPNKVVGGSPARPLKSLPPDP